MNNKGIVQLFTIMFAVAIIILALGLTPAVKQFADTARNSSTDTTVGLDCSNSSINDFNQANCVATDLMIPLFLGMLIAIAGAIAGAKLILQ